MNFLISLAAFCLTISSVLGQITTPSLVLDEFTSITSNATVARPYQNAVILGAAKLGSNRYVWCAYYIAVPQTLIGTYYLGVFESTDDGNTWNELDSAHHPVMGAFTTGNPYATYYPPGGNLLYTAVAYTGTTGPLAVQQFNFTTGLWGTADRGGPTAYQRGQDCLEMGTSVLSDGTQVITYFSHNTTPLEFSVVNYSWGSSTWGTPSIVTQDITNHDYQIMGLIVDPSDVSHILYQDIDALDDLDTMYHVTWSGGTVGSPQQITVLNNTDDCVFNFGNNICEMGGPGTFSTALNAILFPFYQFPSTNLGAVSILIGTLGSPITWTLVPGPTLTGDQAVASNLIFPVLAYDNTQSNLYFSMEQLGLGEGGGAGDTEALIWYTQGSSWNGPTVQYDVTTNPPSPPPGTHMGATYGLDHITIGVTTDVLFLGAIGVGGTSLPEGDIFYSLGTFFPSSTPKIVHRASAN